MPKIFHFIVIEMALVGMAEELLSLQDLEHLLEMFYIFLWCLVVDKNFVKVYQYALPNLIGEDLVYERLEDSWSIHYTKRQHLELIESIKCPRCCFLTILWLYPNLIVSLH